MGYSGGAQDVRMALLRGAVRDLAGGRYAAAEQAARRGVALAPDDVEAALLLGLAVAAQGDARRAAPLLLRVARARPGFAHPCRDLAQLGAGHPAVVAAQYRACRATAPDDAGLAYSYAEYLLEARNPASSAAVLRAVLASQPAFGAAQNLYGMALIDLGDIPAAIDAFRAAAARAPDQPGGWSNLGMALKIEGRFDEAAAAHDRAVAAAPGDPRIRLNRAIALLRAGRWDAAWPDYEARLHLGGTPPHPPDRLLPDLSALPDLAGRTILAWHEEGFGDTIQFCRYVPLLAARGARVVLQVPPPLARLMASLPGAVCVVTEAARVPAYDWHVPFFSLPRVFASTPDSVPAAIPYLSADPAQAAAWRARLPQTGVRAGLVWSGQARPWLEGFSALDARRSMTLADLLPLAEVPGLTLVSLQKGPAATAALAPPRPMALHDPMADAADFADTAAIIATLDVVVSVDTAVAHLAAALGKPVLLLDRYDSCWRWLAGREDSPWYPTLHILRQSAPGDWAPVVARAAQRLRTIAASVPDRRFPAAI